MDSGIYITLGIGVAYAYAYGALLQCAQITMGKRRAVISGAGGYTETQIKQTADLARIRVLIVKQHNSRRRILGGEQLYTVY